MGSILWIPVIFGICTVSLYGFSSILPGIDSVNSTVNSSALKFPSNIDELSSLATFLSAYKEQHHFYVLILFAMAYLWKQTFAIPGSVFLNLLAGALFGVWIGFPLACVLTATGATNCYMLSHFFGKSYIIKYFPDRIRKFQEKIQENMDSLFFFLLFLRLFPMSPNWFMNMVAPILNVPVPLFFFSVLIGLMPYNFICIQTGCFLSQLSSMDDIFTIWTFLKLLLIANIALIPGVFIKRYQEKRALERKRVELEERILQKEQELREIEEEEARLIQIEQMEARIRREQEMLMNGVPIEYDGDSMDEGEEECSEELGKDKAEEDEDYTDMPALIDNENVIVTKQTDQILNDVKKIDQTEKDLNVSTDIDQKVEDIKLLDCKKIIDGLTQEKDARSSTILEELKPDSLVNNGALLEGQNDDLKASDPEPIQGGTKEDLIIGQDNTAPLQKSEESHNDASPNVIPVSSPEGVNTLCASLENEPNDKERIETAVENVGSSSTDGKIKNAIEQIEEDRRMANAESDVFGQSGTKGLNEMQESSSDEQIENASQGWAVVDEPISQKRDAAALMDQEIVDKKNDKSSSNVMMNDALQKVEDILDDHNKEATLEKRVLEEVVAKESEITQSDGQMGNTSQMDDGTIAKSAEKKDGEIKT